MPSPVDTVSDELLVAFIAGHRAPTVRAMADHMGVGISATFARLKRLEKLGRLRRRVGKRYVSVTQWMVVK